MVAWIVTCVFAGATASVQSQEYSPVVEDRVEAGGVQAPLADAAAERRGGWDLDAVISAAYDDNIFLSASEPESDLVIRLSPSAAYRQGDAKEGEGFSVKAGYRPTAVMYVRNGSESRIDHQALAEAGWRGKATRLVYSGAVQKLGDATAETGRPTDRVEFENEIRVAWIPREKVTLEFAGADERTNYSDPAFFDSSKTAGQVALRYAYSPKTEVGVIYQISRFKVDGTGPQHAQGLAGSIAWQPREKIRFNVVAGAERRKTDNGTSVNPVLEGRMEWKPREETGVYLAAYMREEASAFYAGQNYSVRGVTGGITQRLGGKWSIQLDGGYESNRYEVVSGSGTGGREDQIWFVRPAFVRSIGTGSEVSFFYRVSDNQSNDPSFGYAQRMIGMELNHKF